MPEKLICKVFETYKETVFIYGVENEIKGFVLYQEWPDCLNFIMICLPFSLPQENLRIMQSGRHLLPRKKIVWFDEKQMKARNV